ncbi:MAG: hypothetical protein R6U26_03940 [Candidatus Undinarchaeales archaeon]
MKRKGIVNLLLPILAAFGIGVLTTELLAERIFFSLFIGIPAGLIAGVVVWIILNYKFKG